MARNMDLHRSNVAGLRERPEAQVLVIGGGINGLGTFRDLALQGIDVALVERSDYASGASSASSHMIHGGVRYLENGEFRLVREAVHERNGLLKIAPHYVKPLRTTIPIFRTFSGIVAAPLRFVTHKQRSTVERGALLIKLGLTIYDSFSRDGGTIPRHVFRRSKAALRDLPRLNPAVKYAATYYDASVHEPERLALDVLRDARAAAGPARAANYVAAVGVADGRVRLRDEITGEEFAFHADLIINASGPWTDLTNGALGRTTRLMGGTKGSHIVLDSPELLAACAGRELFFENSDGRIVLIYPLRGKVMVGTTDLEADIAGPIRCTDAEVRYFFDLIAHVFPDVRVDESQIVYRFAGVRPLPAHGDTQPGFVSRDYRIDTDRPANLPGTTVLSLVGGKWTTFRAVAERLTDTALSLLGEPRRVSTNGLPIGGGRDYPADGEARRRWIAEHRDGLSPERAEQLLRRYGTNAEEVIGFLAEHGDDPLAATTEFTVQELEHMVLHEDVVHVHDVLMRRTSSAFDGAVTSAVIEETAAHLQTLLGWSGGRLADEVAETTRILADEHGVRLERPAAPVGGR
ncbi:MAG TPA: glycerol-3-phosphate dehydrogenase/oxidase [Microbacteriaceae bacterium]|nr:glycerol-3-phosphate dehydrogenase/oxidase [Microbacteriaceae bacterium]